MDSIKFFRVKISSILLLILFIGTIAVNAQPADSPWPMFHGNLRHTGLSPYNTSHVDGTVKWTFETGAGIESSPVIGTDGTIYFGAHDNKFYAVNPNGTLKWKFNAGEPVYIDEWNVWKGITCSPAIDKDGTIYFVSMSNYLFALNSDGTEKWRYQVHDFADTWLAPVIGNDGTIYVGSENYPPGKNVQQEIGANFYAINPDGSLKWKYESGSAGFGNYAAIGKDGTIYAVGGDFEQEIQTFAWKVVAFNQDGTVKWKFKPDPDAGIEGSPTIADDGTIYIGTKNGKFYALNPDGTQKWVFQAGDDISVTAAIASDGTILFGSWNGIFYALDKEGKEKWHFQTPEGFEALSSSPAIGADGTIYFGSTQNGFYALNSDGSEKWHITTPNDVISSPAIGADGTIYFGAWDNKLYAIGGAQQEPEKEITPSQGKNESTIASEENITNDNKIKTEAPPSEGILSIYEIGAVVIIIIIGAIILLKKFQIK